MKIIKVSQLQGGEYLACPVETNEGKLLFYEGTCVHPVQISRLIENGIEEVKIFEDDLCARKSTEIIKKEIHTDCKKKVKNILNSYVCKEDESLEEITEAANEIIEDIFQKEELAEKVYDIKERNADIYDHSITVAALSVITAVKMNLDRNLVYSIGVGSLLHDMGLKYISVDYRNTDPNTFTPENLFEFKKHTVYGFSSVEKESWMSSSAKKIILFHHEKVNGTGYPLKQVSIPIEVKIVSVCDAFDDRICGIGCEQIHVPDAIEHLRKFKDIYYDGKVVDIFLEFVAKYPVGTKVVTSLGDTALVVEQNNHFTDKPKIKLLYDKDGNEYSSAIVLNLAEKRNISIEKVVE